LQIYGGKSGRFGLKNSDGAGAGAAAASPLKRLNRTEKSSSCYAPRYARPRTAVDWWVQIVTGKEGAA
jgi:hypothetical protein